MLQLMTDGKKWTTLRVAETIGCTQKEVYACMSNLRNSLCVRPGPRGPGFSEYTITDTGRQRLRRHASIEAAREMRYIPTEPLVKHAIRTNPTSVFQLAQF